MTHQAPPTPPAPGADPGRQVAQLREALLLVRTIAGEAADPHARDAMMDEAARMSAAYDLALPIVQRRFDALTAETAAWVSAAIEMLLVAPDQAPLTAAQRLVDALEGALAELQDLLRAPA